ncbi:hypothetical protein [Tabrizicola sp.]|uniref:hypothetical protein n=1 Tax=Tabrizicola sp. TaxID=2005166 RepID=UPI003F2EF1E9
MPRLLGGTDDWQRDASHWVYPAFGLGEAGIYSGAMAKLRAQTYDTPVPLPTEGWPMLVTFDNIASPETVREVDPEDLGAVFGEGVRLKAVTLEITREAVTEGRVEGLLGWLGPYPEPHLIPGDGRSTDIPFGMAVSHGDFARLPAEQ